MLFRPKKINKGFDRIFFVIAIIAAISFGFYVADEMAGSETCESYRDFSNFIPLEEFMGMKEKEIEEFSKKEGEPLAHELLRQRKQHLEKEGYRVISRKWSPKQKDYVDTDDANAPDLIMFYPPISTCIAWGTALAGIGFLIVFFSSRGLALLVLWIKQGFSEKE